MFFPEVHEPSFRFRLAGARLLFVRGTSLAGGFHLRFRLAFGRGGRCLLPEGLGRLLSRLHLLRRHLLDGWYFLSVSDDPAEVWVGKIGLKRKEAWVGKIGLAREDLVILDFSMWFCWIIFSFDGFFFLLRCFAQHFFGGICISARLKRWRCPLAIRPDKRCSKGSRQAPR